MGKPIAKDGTTLHIYVGKEFKSFIDRLEALAENIPGVSVSGLILACIQACTDTLEKEVPVKREFMMNGKKIVR